MQHFMLKIAVFLMLKQLPNGLTEPLSDHCDCLYNPVQ